jgi:hypothetical protein
MKKEKDAARKERKDTGKSDGLENTSDEGRRRLQR